MARAGMSLRAIARVLGVSTMAAWGWVRIPEREGLVARRPRRQTYRSVNWKVPCSARGVTSSMPRPGRSDNNAPAENLFCTFKIEFLVPLDRLGVGLSELEMAIGDHMKWYGDGKCSRFEKRDGEHSNKKTISKGRGRLVAR